MLTTPYSLKRDYSASTPVSAGDLNRRARVLATQLPGALRGAALSAGVFPLWNPAPGLSLDALITDLVARAQNSLQVTRSGALFVASAGAAVIEASDNFGTAPLLYTQTTGLSVAAETPQDDDTLYIHLALQLPTDPLAPGALDSTVGDAPTLLVSDTEEEPGALLLASITAAGGLQDRRTFSTPVLLALEMDALRQRLDALSAPTTAGEGSEGGLTLANFNDLLNRTSALEGTLADLRAQIAKLGGGNDPFPAPFDILADEIALTRSGLAEVNPPAIERGQISLIVANAGKGQNDTPNFAPNTPTPNDPLELPWDAQQGLFGP
ncbi:hypothetical protein IAD21_00701 [Abditibacteriota bacterium]|nr:hypothetical protein IAD21_00701 [Abditibacteriota bacterium]